jgi:hypothetical protein
MPQDGSKIDLGGLFGQSDPAVPASYGLYKSSGRKILDNLHQMVLGYLERPSDFSDGGKAFTPRTKV